MTIIAKNNSGSVQKFLSVVLEDGEQKVLTDFYTGKEIDDDIELAALITSGDIVLNDGTSDLSISEAQGLVEGGEAELVTQAEAEAGTGLIVRDWNALRVKQAVDANAGDSNVQSDWNATSGDAFILNKPPLVDAARNLFVDLNGNDTTGTGSRNNPYRTVGKGVTVADTMTPTTVNPVNVNVATGAFVESPLTVNSGVCVCGDNTVLVTDSPTLDFITLSEAGYIQGCTVTGVTTVGKYCIVASGTAAGSPRIIDVAVGVSSTGGIKLTSTVAGYAPVIQSCYIFGFSGDGLRVESNINLTLANTDISGTLGTSRGLVTDGDAVVETSSVRITNCGTGAYHNSTGLLKTDVVVSGCTIPAERIGVSPVQFKDAELDLDRVVTSSTAGLVGTILNTAEETKYQILNELSVGVVGDGRRSVFGEGDSYSNGMQVWTDNGSTFTNVTEAASSSTGSTFTFPNTSVNTAIYFSTLRSSVDSGDFLKFFDAEVVATVAKVGGTIVLEYWDGSSWVQFNHMSRDSSPPYNPYEKRIFERVSTEHIRYDKDIDNDWTKNDPVSLGVSLYWIRYRISSALTTAPVFEKWKVGTNRTEIEEDGYQNYFGKARTVGKLDFNASNFQAANNSPVNNDLYFGDNLGVGMIENSFSDSATDRSGLVTTLPQDLDTSCKILARFKMYMINGGGNVYLTLRWANNSDGDGCYESTTYSPSSHPREQTLTKTVSVPSPANEQFSVEFEMDVSDFITKSDTGGDLLVLTIQRSGNSGNDTNSDNMVLIQLDVLYTKWSNGGHQ